MTISINEGSIYNIEDVLICSFRAVSACYKRDSLTYFLKQFDKNVMVEQLVENGNKYDVKFSQPLVAGEILPKRDFWNGCIAVESLKTLQQPDDQKFIVQLSAALKLKNLNTNYNRCEDETKASILLLNDNCIDRIFNYLNISDQIYFAVTCQRICDIFASLSKVKYKFLNTLDLNFLKSFKTRVLLQIIGAQIEKLLVAGSDGNNVVLLHLLATYCPNVKNLQISHTEAYLLNNLIENMPLLEEVTMVYCYLEDDFIKSLKTLKNLKDLHIIDTFVQCDEVFNVSSNLEKVTCGRMYEFLTLENLTNLKYLDIRELCNATECYEDIANTFLQLETLKINCSIGDFSCLTKLPKLKVLDITFEGVPDMSIIRQFSYNLINCPANQLQRFGISLRKPNLEIGTAVSKLKGLKVLKWFCKGNKNVECIKLFVKLSQLEVIQFKHPIKFYLILQLLQNCLKLKQIVFRCPLMYGSGLITKLVAFLQKQRDLGLRADCVEFVVFQNEEKVRKKIFKKYSNVLKITRRSEYFDMTENYLKFK